jgi:uncharacterized protein YjbI with pentapeptide repeats
VLRRWQEPIGDASRTRVVGLGVAGTVVGLIAAVVIVKFVPPWVADPVGLKGKDRAEEIGRARTAVLAILAGAVASVGAVFTALSYRLNRQGHELDRAGQITERFTRAIEQLGNSALDVRLGGIYALERIARDSADDHPQVVEVLTAFVRGHARNAPAADGDRARNEDPDEPRDPPTDVQAAMTVLGRRNVAQDSESARLDLTRTDLRGYRISKANLANADLTKANLASADLTEANLANADLDDANLEGAVLRAADLQGARLNGANLERIDVAEAILRHASLFQANLRGANLVGASLERADLRSADLERARLVQANLEGASVVEANLREATLDDANLRVANLGGVNLQGAWLAGAKLEGGVNLAGANLVGANLAGANLQRADLERADLQGANLSRANLQDAYLGGAKLKGARCGETQWPTSEFDARAHGATETGN